MRKSERTPIDQCDALRIGDLRRGGALVPGQMRHGTLEFPRTGAAPLVLQFTADLRRADSAFIDLRHPDSDEYRIAIVETVFGEHGGIRLSFRCPIRGVKSVVIYLPPGGTSFASAKGHRLLTGFNRLAKADRPLHHLRLARERLARATAPKAVYRGGRGAEAGTIDRLRAAVALAEQRIWNQQLAKSREREIKDKREIKDNEKPPCVSTGGLIDQIG